MALLEILAGAFALFAMSRVFLRAKERKISIAETAFWVLVWVGMLVILLVPEASSFIAKPLGIGRGLDLAFSAGLVVLFYLLFRLYVKVDAMERDITSLVREEALRGMKK